MKAYTVKHKTFTNLEKAIEFAIVKKLGSSAIYPNRISFGEWFMLKMVGK